MNRDSYVGIKEASKYLGVSSVTIRKWVRNGDLKSLMDKSERNGRDMYLIHKDELKFFKNKVMPSMYGKKNVPKVYRKKTWKDKLCDIWEWLKNAF